MMFRLCQFEWCLGYFKWGVQPPCFKRLCSCSWHGPKMYTCIWRNAQYWCHFAVRVKTLKSENLQILWLLWKPFVQVQQTLLFLYHECIVVSITISIIISLFFLFLCPALLLIFIFLVRAISAILSYTTFILFSVCLTESQGSSINGKGKGVGQTSPRWQKTENFNSVVSSLCKLLFKTVNGDTPEMLQPPCKSFPRHLKKEGWWTMTKQTSYIIPVTHELKQNYSSGIPSERSGEKLLVWA